MSQRKSRMTAGCLVLTFSSVDEFLGLPALSVIVYRDTSIVVFLLRIAALPV